MSKTTQKQLHNWIKSNLDSYHPALLYSTVADMFFEIAIQDSEDEAKNFLAFAEELGFSKKKAQDLIIELDTEFDG